MTKPTPAQIIKTFWSSFKEGAYRECVRLQPIIVYASFFLLLYLVWRKQ